jgi:predicted RNA polymerase sigma factor
MTAAKHRALDHLRRHKLLQRKHEQLAYELDGEQDPTTQIDQAIDDGVSDDLLRLILIACHPVLAAPARVALTLRLLGGLSSEEIARAYLVEEATIAQRIVGAKRTLQVSQVPFEVPRREDLGARVGSVLEVIYLIFNEGYAATRGDDWLRPALCEDAMRLGRILAGLLPDEAEVHGLVALMELGAARLPARTGADGEPVLLLEQDRSRWDGVLVQHGLRALARAEQLGGAGGPYALQAAISACHARARTAEDTNWPRIAALYLALAERTRSPVVELNRAVAVAMAFGPAEGLRILDDLQEVPALKNYHLLPLTRGDLLFKLGRLGEAGTEFARALELTQNERERSVIARRIAECDPNSC